MPGPLAQASVVLGRAYDQLGVAASVYNVFSDGSAGSPRWQQLAIVNALADWDLNVQRACAETPGSYFRNYFVQDPPASLNNGDPLPVNSIGPPQAVWITNFQGITKLGRPAPSTWIDYFNNDTDGVFGLDTQFTDGYYTVIDGRVYFSGSKAQVYYCAIARANVPSLPALPTLASPEAFTDTLAKGIVSWAYLKESDYPDSAQLFGQAAMADLQSIRGGASEVAPIELVQKQAA